jgi:hypothetical protein
MSMDKVLQFLFVVAVPLVVVAGAIATLFAVGALFYALEHPESLRRSLEGMFRKGPRPPKAVRPDHYYRTYWAK